LLTILHLRGGARGRFEFLDSLGDPAVVSLRSVEKATSGPVSTMANIAAEACKMFGIPRKMFDSAD
jgi:hypothetical protein